MPYRGPGPKNRPGGKRVSVGGKGIKVNQPGRKRPPGTPVNPSFNPRPRGLPAKAKDLVPGRKQYRDVNGYLRNARDGEIVRDKNGEAVRAPRAKPGSKLPTVALTVTITNYYLLYSERSP